MKLCWGKKCLISWNNTYGFDALLVAQKGKKLKRRRRSSQTVPDPVLAGSVSQSARGFYLQ